MKVTDIAKYGAYFSAPKFMAFVNKYGKNLIFVRRALILFYCMRDVETPVAVKTIIVGALGYLLLPADAVPDAIAGIGWLDDLAVLAFAMRIAESYSKPVLYGRA